MKVPSPEPYPLPRTCWTTLPQNPIPCLAAARERPPWPQGSQVATASRESGHHRQAVATWTGREGRVQAPSSVAGGTLGPLAAWASKPLASRTSVPPPPRRLKASSNNRVEGASTPPHHSNMVTATATMTWICRGYTSHFSHLSISNECNVICYMM
jgi:hypothetical protein